MIRRLFIVVFVASLAIAASSFHPITVGAQSSQFSSFSLQASSTFFTIGQSTTLNVTIFEQNGTPTGDLEYYISSSSRICSLTDNVIGVVGVNTPAENWTPSATGTFPVCVLYIPGPNDLYGSDTAGPVLVTVNAAPSGNPLTKFDLGASPNPAGDGVPSTLTAYLSGGFGVPPGTVQFYVSTSSTSCLPFANFTSTVPVSPLGNGTSDAVATTQYDGFTPGTFSVCAAYIPAQTDPYVATTTGPYLLTVNQPAILTVSVPAETTLNQTLPFTFNLPVPVGQVAPTGTITLYDPNISGGNFGSALGSIQVNGGGSYGPLNAALSTTSYTAVYSGDANYEQQVVNGTLLLESGLISISPAAVTPGASTTTTYTLTGPRIKANSLVKVLIPGAPIYITPSSFNLSAPIPQLQFTIPTALNVGEFGIDLVVSTGNAGYFVTGGPVFLQVYNQYTDTVTTSTTPTSIPYGTSLTSNFNANVARGATTDAAVPVGQVDFTLNGTGGNTYSSPLGSAQLSQVSTPGTYISPFIEPMDANGSGKLLSADLNGDGFVDVVGLPAFNYGFGASAPYLQVMLSTGYNAFQTEQQVYAGCIPQDFAVGDVNNDGIPDLVVVCASSSFNTATVTTLAAYYMPGVGDGTFLAPIAFGGNSFIGNPTQVVLGNFNNLYSGGPIPYLQIAVIDGIDGVFQVFDIVQNTQGQQVNFASTVSAYGPVVAAAAADFDQDGFTDLVLEDYTSNSGNGAISVFLNEQYGYGYYIRSQNTFTAGSYYVQSMAVTDVNGDGYPDVAITDPGGNPNFSDNGNYLVFENTGSSFPGSLTSSTSVQVNGVGAIAGAPFPVIGQPASGAAIASGWNLVYTFMGNNNDLWVGEAQRISAGTWTLLNSFDTGQLPYSNDSSPGTLPDFIVTGDMNGDGYLDFALNGTTSAQINQCPATQCNLQPWYYSNDAQTSINGSSLSPLPVPGTYNLTANYDGSPLYLSNSGNSTVNITQGTPTGMLTVSPTSSPYAYGTGLTFNASVIGVANGVAPSQYVTFLDNGSQFDLEYLISDGGTTGTTSSFTSSLTPGLHNICISYSGDSYYNAVNNVACTSIQISSISISLTSTAPFDGSAFNVTAGTVVNLLVQGAGSAIPTGQTITLTGLPNAAPVTPITNGIGVASYQYGLFAPGTYTIQASFLPPGSQLNVTSNTITLNVSNTPVNVTLNPSANPVTYPTAIGLVANATTDGLGVPTGFISFQNNGSPFASFGLSSTNGSSGLTYSGIVDANPELTDRAVVTGDFNGDGNPDIAVLQGNNTGSLLISLGNGDGTFQAAQTFTVDSTAVAMAVADFNKDGDDDLVIANSDGTVSVYLSSVNGNVYSLALSQTLSMPGAIGVATGDFNGDGFSDFAVISSNQILAFYNNGAANFPVQGSWGATSDTAQYTGITVADFNQDQFADIAVTDSSVPDVAVFIDDRDGGFLSPSFNAVGVSAIALASGDINGDGFPDLAVVSNSDSTVAVLINNGTSSPGTFGAQNSYGIAYQPTAIAMNDFNQDGYADIAVVGTGFGAGTGTTILLGSSSGNMYGETSIPSGNFSTNGLSIATGDFNEDGNPDLVVGNNGASIFLDTGAQASVSNVLLPAGTSPLTGIFTAGETIFTEGNSPTLFEVVNQATPTLNWTNPAAIPYGTPLSATQLNATATFAGTSLPGTFTYTPAAGTLLTAGPHTLSVSFVPDDSVDYTATTTTVQIDVGQASTTVTWNSPAPITYGTALSATQLDATASVPGTLTYTPAVGTVLTAGIHQLTVDFVPTDSINFASATGTVTLTVNQAVPSVTWANPAAITYGTALSGTQLDASSPVAGSFTYTPAAGTILTAGAHQLAVSFVPTDNVDYAVATASVSIAVNQVAPSITWTAPAAITYGTALSATQLSASSSVAGTFAYNPVAGTVLTAGAHTLSVTFTPTDTTDYSTATSSVQLTVNQATPAITWAAPGAITYGTALSATQLSASSPVAGTFAYNPAAGTVLTAGVHTLSVTFTPTDTTDYSTATSNVQLTVNQATPSITWAPPAAITYGTALSATQLSASSPVAGSFVYNPIAGTVLTAGVHTLSVTFTPTDTTDYTTATSSVQLTVNQATPSITWTTPAAITYGTALSAAQLSASSPVAGSFVYNPVAGTVLTAGTHTLSVTFTPTDTTDYSTATSSVQLTVNRATPSITWATPAAITYGTTLSATQLSASSPVAGTFAYNPIAGTVLTAGAHTLNVTFTPTDTTDYTTATSSVQLTVNQATPSITWTAPAAITYGTALSATQLSASSPVAGTFAYNPIAGTVLTAGAHTLSVTFTPTDATDYTTATSSVQLTVNQATPSITWTAPAAITYGTALSATQLSASSTIPGTFVYNPAAGTVLTAGTHTLSVTFTPTDATDYTTATSTVQLTVNRATPAISWATPGTITYGTALSATQLAASSPVAGTFAYSPVAGTVLTAGAHTLSVTFTPTDATDYTTATSSVQITVNQATPSITWTAPAAITYGTALSATQLSASSPVAGTFAYNPVAGTILTAGTHTLSVTFTPTDATDYTTATSSVQIIVSQATPSITWAPPAAITYGTALSATQLAARSPVAGSFAYNPIGGTVLTAGGHTLSVTFTPTDTTDYTTATSSVQLTVNQATSLITWAPPAAITYGTALSATQLAASSPVAGVFAYNPVAGTVLTAGVHTLSVTFTPTDTTDYTTATSSVQLTVNKATSTITWSNPAAITYGTPLSASQLNATASVPGTLTYTPATGTILAVGPHTLTVTFTPTDTTDYSPASGSVSITVNQANSPITWPAPAAITYGTALGASQLDATTSIPGTLTYSPAAGTILGAGPQTLNVTFTPTDTVDYSTATASVLLQVNQATPVITWSNPAAITYGTVLSATQLNATATPSGGTFTYSPPAGSVLPVGTQTLRVTYTPLDATNYAVATSSVTIQVSSASTALELVSSTSSATAGAVVTFQVQANGTALPAGQTITLTGLPTAAAVNLTLNGDGFASYSYGLFPPGTYTVQASFAGSASFGASASNTVSLDVAPAAVKVALASSANPVTYPTPIGLTATATSDGLGVPTGSISFQDNGIQIGSGTLTTINGSSGLASVGTLDSITGQTVIAVVTGDFNKDGNKDIAALESGSGVATLLISLGNGDGTFQAPVTYASSSGIDPTSVAMAAGDFNGDGYTDLVLAASDGNLAIMMAAGNAAGDLAISQELEASGLLGVATGDFNKDGNQDIAVISSNTVTAFYGTGSTPSNFQYANSWSATLNSSSFTGITVADFNHDGYADIAVSDNAGPDAAVFLYNTDGGGFTGPQNYPVAGSADAIASGDINGDSYSDLVVASTVDSTVDVLINNGSSGSGTFPAGTTYGVGSQPVAITMNDFNKDGHMDIAVAGTGQGGGTTILLGSSTGAMTGETSLAAVYGQSITSADFNNDGNPDLAVGLNGIAEFIDSAAQAGVANIVLPAGTEPLTAVFTPSTSSIFGGVTSTSLSEVVNSAGATISWPSPASIIYGTALSATQLDATSSVPGTFTYTPGTGTVLTVGTHQLNVAFVPTDSVDYVGASSSVSITVTQAGSTVSWSNPAGITYGTALTSTQLDATASVPGTFTYSPALGTVLTAGTHQLSASFVPNDTVDYLGSTATASITVSKASTTITWSAPASIAYGTPLSATQFDATASVPGTFAFTPALGTVLTAGSHTLTSVFTPTDSVDYSSSTSTVSITVNRANPSIIWTAPAAITYGTALGVSQLDATPSTAGTLTYNPPAGTRLGAGPQTLNVSFTPTDTTDYNAATASVPIQVNQATPVITWPTPTAIGFGIQLSAAQLNATASPSGGSFTYTPSVGTVLPEGTQTLNVIYTPADTIDYTTASASVTIQVNAGLTFTSVSPASGAYQSPSTLGTPVTVTLTGTGFSPSSIVKLAWASGPTTLSTSYTNSDQLTATIPAAFFEQTQAGAISVTDPGTGQTSGPIPITVTLPNIKIVFTGPGSESEAEQPSLNLQFLDGYPVPLTVNLNLSVQPATPGGPVDPAVQFATGGTAYSFILPANSINAPTIQLQTGTLAGTITVILTLQADGQDVTPAGLQPVIIIVPATAPVVTSISLTRNGNTLTVTVQGYSSTRDMSTALFNFTPATGDTLQDPQLTVDVATDFSTWYTQQTSIQYGSAFTYTQAFDLSGDASTIGGVSVTLTNSVGASNVVTAN